MKCFQCGKEIVGSGVLISADGDFVCDKICEHNYIKEKEVFFTEIVNSETKTKEWLEGND